VKDQRTTALAKADATRLARSRVKQAIHKRQMTVAEAWELPCVASMAVYRLLAVQFRWSENRALTACNRAGVGYNRLVGQLTAREALETLLGLLVAMIVLDVLSRGTRFLTPSCCYAPLVLLV
jgi:hypothetical protein